MHSKLITATILSLGLATGAFAQSSVTSGSTTTNGTEKHDSGSRVDPGTTNSTTGGAMGNAAGTKDTRTNCAPNLQTQGSATTPNATGSASVQSGEAGTNTNGQASSC